MTKINKGYQGYLGYTKHDNFSEISDIIGYKLNTGINSMLSAKSVLFLRFWFEELEKEVEKRDVEWFDDLVDKVKDRGDF